MKKKEVEASVMVTVNVPDDSDALATLANEVKNYDPDHAISQQEYEDLALAYEKLKEEKEEMEKDFNGLKYDVAKLLEHGYLKKCMWNAEKTFKEKEKKAWADVENLSESLYELEKYEPEATKKEKDALKEKLTRARVHAELTSGWVETMDNFRTSWCYLEDRADNDWHVEKED